MVCFFALTFLLCLAEGRGWALHSETINSLPVENPQETIHEKKYQENVPPQLEAHNAEHPGALPITYKLYWIGLILLVILLLVYFLIIYKKEKFTSLKPLTIVLLLLALSLYLLEQGRIFTGYFDPSMGKFVSPFHEPNTIEFLRFLYKLMAGIALCMYGFIIFFSHKSLRPNNRYEEK